MSAPLTPACRRALRRVPQILAADIASTDDDLREHLGLAPADVRLVIAILYRQRRVDRIRQYVVLPADCEPAAAECEAA